MALVARAGGLGGLAGAYRRWGPRRGGGGFKLWRSERSELGCLREKMACKAISLILNDCCDFLSDSSHPEHSSFFPFLSTVSHPCLRPFVNWIMAVMGIDMGRVLAASTNAPRLPAYAFAQ